MSEEFKTTDRPRNPVPERPPNPGPDQIDNFKVKSARRNRYYILFRKGQNGEADLYKCSDGNYYRRYERTKTFKLKTGEQKTANTVQYQRVKFRYEPDKPRNPKTKSEIDEALIKFYQTLKTLNLSFEDINNLKKMAVGLYIENCEREKNERQLKELQNQQKIKEWEAKNQQEQKTENGGELFGGRSGGGDGHCYRDYFSSPADSGQNSEDERREADEVDSPSDSQEEP